MSIIRLRRYTSSEWSSQNPVLASGEPGFDITANVLKIGDGVTVWNSLTSEARFLGSSTLAARPAAAGNTGFYYATDTDGGTLYYSNSVSWIKIASANNTFASVGTNAVGGTHTGTVSNIQHVAGSVVNADISPNAAIAESKLALSTPTALIAGMMKIAEFTAPGGGSTNFDFTNIPATYTHLKLITSLRTDINNTFDDGILTFNNDTTDANYDQQYVQYASSTPTSGQMLGTGFSRHFFAIAGNSSSGGRSASLFSTGETLIIDYASTAHYKIAQSLQADYIDRINNAVIVRNTFMGWASTAAINRITVSVGGGTKFVSGSKASLYGILSAT